VPRDPQPEIHNLTGAVDNIFLIGYRGTGKTTIAPLLAEKLGWSWVDADRVLEERTGRSIRGIFTEEGEAAFRDKEAAVLEELCSKGRQVIATGGGVVLREANRQRLLAAGRVAWLKADAQTIWERLQNDPVTAAQRPNLSVGGRAEIEAMLEVRSPLYSTLADCSVDTVGRKPQEIAGAILELLATQR
jgi:shikimate kinase